jgi:hypothetical protein
MANSEGLIRPVAALLTNHPPALRGPSEGARMGEEKYLMESSCGYPKL